MKEDQNKDHNKEIIHCNEEIIHCNKEIIHCNEEIIHCNEEKEYLFDKEKEYLLDNIDIPFFNNNLDYINAWIKYYHAIKDIGILFLMKYKKISNDYHWIHLELARFFKKKGKEGISVYILQKALENKVYDSSIIKNELDNYKGIETVTEGYAYRYLFPKGFSAFGRVWNSFVNYSYCNEEILKWNELFISLEEYRFNIKIRDLELHKEGNEEENEELHKEGNEELHKEEGNEEEMHKEDNEEKHEKIGLDLSEENFSKVKNMNLSYFNKSKESINLLKFIKTIESASIREQGLILEYCLMQILNYIIQDTNEISEGINEISDGINEKDIDTNEIDIDFNTCTVNMNFNINFSFRSCKLSNIAILDEVYLFFDRLSSIKILTKDCLKTFDDLFDKIALLNVKFNLKENIHIINKQKIIIAEMIFND